MHVHILKVYKFGVVYCCSYRKQFLYVILDMLVQCTFRHQIHLLQKKKNVLLHTIEKRFNNSDHHILIFVVPHSCLFWQKELYALLLLFVAVVSPINGVIQLSGRSSIQNMVIRILSKSSFSWGWQWFVKEMGNYCIFLRCLEKCTFQWSRHMCLVCHVILQ